MRRSNVAQLTLLGTALIAFGCTEAPSAPGDQAARMLGEDDPNAFVSTPVGLLHKSCVHEVPSGASIDRNNFVTLKSGVSYQLSPCLHYGGPGAGPSIVRTHGGGIETNNNGPSITRNNTSEYGLFSLTGTNTFRQTHVNFYVPDVPVPGYSDSQTYFALTEIDDGFWELITALQWGKSDAGGGLFWTLGAWRCEFAVSCIHTGLQRAAPGDQISSDITASNCSGTPTHCDYLIQAHDLTNGVIATQTSSTDARTYTTMMAAVEHWSLVGCSYFPIDGIGFTNMSAQGVTGGYTVAMQGYVNTSVTPQCGFNALPITNGILFSHNMTTIITGPSLPFTGVNSTWTENGIGPDPHTYQWYRNDTLQAGQTGASFTYQPILPGPFKLGLKSYNIRTHWTDSVTMTPVGTFTVSMSGPVNVKAGGLGSEVCPYSATVGGGVPPKTFLWTLDGVNQPDHSQSQQFDVSGPNGGTHYITVQVTDNTNTVRNANVLVHNVTTGGTDCGQ